MLNPDQALALFMEDTLGLDDGKMGYGVLRYSSNPVVCVIDSSQAGKQVSDVVVDLPRDCPVVATVEEARQLGAEVMVLGIAPSGGRIPEPWMNSIERAVKSGMSIINGLHDVLEERFGGLVNAEANQWIWDVRHPIADPPSFGGEAGGLNNKRVLLVGTDMAIGKMTAGLEIYRWIREKNPSTAFLATGQVGITITGRGIPLDGYKVDHACNAVAELVMSAADKEIVFIEGQGSLLHARSTATLPLLRGSCPTHLILCHRAGMETLDRLPNVKVPPLPELIELYETLASACGSFARPATIGIALKTNHLSDEDSKRAIADLEDETALPVTDVVRYSAEKLGRELLQK